jgi:hypothetical protein
VRCGSTAAFQQQPYKKESTLVCWTMHTDGRLCRFPSSRAPPDTISAGVQRPSQPLSVAPRATCSEAFSSAVMSIVPVPVSAWIDQTTFDSQLAKHGCTDACLIRSSRLFHATVASPSHTYLDSSSPDYLRAWRRGEFAPRHHRNSLAADGLRTFPWPPAEDR